jgi:tetratricopeptide (TPR) repeat protein
LYRINNNIKNLQTAVKNYKKIALAKLQKEKLNAYKLYLKAGEIYKKYNRFNDAGDVYFKTENYEESLKYYRLANNR